MYYQLSHWVNINLHHSKCFVEPECRRVKAPQNWKFQPFRERNAFMHASQMDSIMTDVDCRSIWSTYEYECDWIKSFCGGYNLSDYKIKFKKHIYIYCNIFFLKGYLLQYLMSNATYLPYKIFSLWHDIILFDALIFHYKWWIYRF